MGVDAHCFYIAGPIISLKNTRAVVELGPLLSVSEVSSPLGATCHVNKRRFCLRNGSRMWLFKKKKKLKEAGGILKMDSNPCVKDPKNEKREREKILITQKLQTVSANAADAETAGRQS